MPARASGLALGALAAAAAALAAQDPTEALCRNIHVLLADDTNEPQPSRLHTLVDYICDGLECDWEVISFSPDQAVKQCSAVDEGHQNGLALMAAYAKRCPNAKLVLTGYGVGAVVVGDILDGTNCSAPALPREPLSRTEKVGSKVCAVTLFGDVRHTANQSYNILDGQDKNSSQPRSPGALDAFSRIMLSYCRADDPVCAQGSVPDTHTSYLPKFAPEAANFVRDKCDVCTQGNGTAPEYVSLCTFTCAAGYCPPGPCKCSSHNHDLAKAPPVTGVPGCPAKNRDDSFKGLCSFACNHDYCPQEYCTVCPS